MAFRPFRIAPFASRLDKLGDVRKGFVEVKQAGLKGAHVRGLASGGGDFLARGFQQVESQPVPVLFYGGVGGGRGLLMLGPRANERDDALT